MAETTSAKRTLISARVCAGLRVISPPGSPPGGDASACIVRNTAIADAIAVDVVVDQLATRRRKGGPSRMGNSTYRQARLSGIGKCANRVMARNIGRLLPTIARVRRERRITIPASTTSAHRTIDHRPAENYTRTRARRRSQPIRPITSQDAPAAITDSIGFN